MNAYALIDLCLLCSSLSSIVILVLSYWNPLLTSQSFSPYSFLLPFVLSLAITCMVSFGISGHKIWQVWCGYGLGVPMSLGFPSTTQQSHSKRDNFIFNNNLLWGFFLLVLSSCVKLQHSRDLVTFQMTRELSFSLVSITFYSKFSFLNQLLSLFPFSLRSPWIIFLIFPRKPFFYLKTTCEFLGVTFSKGPNGKLSSSSSLISDSLSIHSFKRWSR